MWQCFNINTSRFARKKNKNKLLRQKICTGHNPRKCTPKSWAPGTEVYASVQSDQSLLGRAITVAKTDKGTLIQRKYTGSIILCIQHSTEGTFFSLWPSHLFVNSKYHTLDILGRKSIQRRVIKGSLIGNYAVWLAYNNHDKDIW